MTEPTPTTATGTDPVTDPNNTTPADTPDTGSDPILSQTQDPATDNTPPADDDREFTTERSNRRVYMHDGNTCVEDPDGSVRVVDGDVFDTAQAISTLFNL